jgi:hypothetical protein
MCEFCLPVLRGWRSQWVRGMADGTALLNSVSRIESLRASVEATDPHRIVETRPAASWPPTGSVRAFDR